jgi:glutathione S-transferase
MENTPYDFKELSIFEGQDAITLNKINPLNQIPVLVDGEQNIWDSRVIFNHLNSKHHFQKMGLDEENLLTAIDGAMNSGVSLLLMKRSGINTNEPFMYVQRQKERIESVLDYLKPFIQDRGLKTWDFHSMSLYCFLDWATFRELISIEHRPDCQNFLKHYQEKPILISTQIPKA